MTRWYVLGGWVSLWLCGCSFEGVEGNGRRVDETREVATFSRVRSDAELDIEVVQGEAQALTISIDSNLQRLITTEVRDDTLYLDLSDHVDRMVAGPHVLIVVPELRAARLAGSGSMTLALDEPALPLDVRLSGSGQVRFDGRAQAVTALLDGSGVMRLAGETPDVELSLSGSGDISGRNLVARHGNLELSGSGRLSANVTDSVRVSLSGSGHVDVFGGAHVDSSQRSGSGDIDFH
jgi:hypothetical protein